MKNRPLIFVWLLLAGILFSACAGQSADSVQPPAVEDLASLSQALRDAEATVETGETVEQGFFAVPGQILKVNGADVQVFEYESAEAMEAEAAQVSTDGGSVGTSMVTWIAPPHFFKSGRVLVLYIGEDTALLDLLRSLLGEQFAGK